MQYMSEYDLYFANQQLFPLLTQIFPRLRLNYYAADGVPRCISYYEAFKDPNQPSDIYKAIDNVVSYMLHRRSCRMKRQKEFGTFSEFYLPIVVLDGRLYEASISPDKIEVTERPHIQLHTYHRENIHVIDVVTRDYFASFFQKVEVLHAEIVAAIRGIKLPPAFRAKAWLKHKEPPDSGVKAWVAMMDTDSEHARQRRGRGNGPLS